MREFVRPVHEYIMDLFILEIEALCDLADDWVMCIEVSLRLHFYVLVGVVPRFQYNREGYTSCYSFLSCLQFFGANIRIKSDNSKY